MKAAQLTAAATSAKRNIPFFNKENGQDFFHPKAIGSSINEQPFFSKNKNNFSGIQTKLTVNQPNDPYEKEADAMADKVVQRLSENNSGVTFKNGNALQTKPVAPVTVINPLVQTKCASCEHEDNMIQRQEQPDESVTKTDTPNLDESTAATPTPTPGFSRAGKCNTSPEFPNFSCLTQALKLDIDENLWKNSYHFYRAASLHPGDNELMWNTFLRYGLGVNLLQTSFGFAGANKTLGTVLSYGTGIGLKSYDFFKNGKLELDVPIPLGGGVNLDLQLDLNADPNNLSKVKGVNTGIGISGHF